MPYSWLVYNLFPIFQNLYMTFLVPVHLSTTFLWLVHNLIMTCYWLVHKFCIFRLCLLHDLLRTCSSLTHDLFMTLLLVLYVSITFLLLVHTPLEIINLNYFTLTNTNQLLHMNYIATSLALLYLLYVSHQEVLKKLWIIWDQIINKSWTSSK